MDRDILDKIQPLIYIADRLEELVSQGREISNLLIAVIEFRADLRYGNLSKYKYAQKE